MRDTFIVFQVLRQDEEVLRMQADVHEDQLCQLVRFYIVQGHVPAVYLQFFHSVLEYEFGQVLQAEFNHLLIFEVD